jgi:hypothetical protein
VVIQIDWIIEFDGNLNLVYEIDHIQRNEIMLSPFLTIWHFKIGMFSNDIHHKMVVLDYGNRTKTYKSREYLCKDFKYGNKDCNEFFQRKDQKLKNFILRWTKYVYGKDDANNIEKKHDNSK